MIAIQSKPFRNLSSLNFVTFCCTASINWPALGNFAVGNFAVRNFAVGNFAVGNFAVGNFAVGNFDVGNFTVRKVRRKEISL